MLLLSEMLSEDGGFACCTKLCQDSRPVEKVYKTTELNRPGLTHARCGSLDYVQSVSRVCGHTLFDLRQPDQIEILKVGAAHDDDCSLQLHHCCLAACSLSPARVRRSI